MLAVPSVVIPTETYYLLNPLHPSFPRIEIGAPEEFVTHLRLIQKGDRCRTITPVALKDVL